MVYLDTHVIVWLFHNKKDKFSDKAIDFIDKNRNILYISPIVILEIEYLYEIERVKDHGKDMVDYLVNRIGLNICRLPFNNVIYESLLQNWTRDPFDRIITSQASLNKAFLITKDETIHRNFNRAIW